MDYIKDISGLREACVAGDVESFISFVENNLSIIDEIINWTDLVNFICNFFS